MTFYRPVAHINLTFRILLDLYDESPVLTPFLGFVFSLTTLILRVSVFVNVVLIVVRTINITRPFYQVNIKRMWIAIFICPIVLLPIIIYDAVQIGELESSFGSKIRYVFLPFVGDFCIKDIVISAVNIKAKKGSKKSIQIPEGVTFATSCAPFILAVIISLVCLAINWRKLSTSQQKMSVSKSGDNSNTEREVTITIGMLTTVFSLCNTVYAGFLTLCWILGLDYWNDQRILQLCYLTSTVFPFISSALNPVILIWRSKKLRESLKNRLLCRNRKKIENVTRSSTATTISTSKL